jgi:hypothetical protein
MLPGNLSSLLAGMTMSVGEVRYSSGCMALLRIDCGTEAKADLSA